MLREALRCDKEGNFIYDLVLWSDIKKSAKSVIAAAVVLYRALRTPYGSFKIVANDKEQAESRVFNYISLAIMLNPRLAEHCTIRNYKILLDNHAVIAAVPIDPKGEAGGGDDMIEFTELHAADSKAAALMWAEMTLSPLKLGKSQRWIDTYAGHSGESPILEPLYERGVKEGKQLDLGIPGLEVFVNGSFLCLWNTVKRCPWQLGKRGKAYYAEEAMVQTISEFDRIHGNQWVTSSTAFVPIEWWMACQQPVPPLEDNEKIVYALDAAVTGDCFAMVGVSRRRNYDTGKDLVYLRYVRIWKPPRGGKIQYTDATNHDNIDYPEGAIRKLAKSGNVAQFAYDPFQLHELATRLYQEGIAWFREFPQGADRLKADKQLYDDIRDMRFVHDGDATLTEHVKNANAKIDPQDHSMRIVKRSEVLKIDACVASSMANSEARRLQIA